MFNFITLLGITFGLLTLTTAKPYTTAAGAGSSQLDVRNNYNSASGYSTSIGYASPFASRIVAAAAAASPFAYSAQFARYSPSPVQANPFAYGPSSVAARYESPVLGAGYASPYAASPFAYAQPFAPSFQSNLASPYMTAYGSPYTIATPGSAPILL